MPSSSWKMQPRSIRCSLTSNPWLEKIRCLSVVCVDRGQKWYRQSYWGCALFRFPFVVKGRRLMARGRTEDKSGYFRLSLFFNALCVTYTRIGAWTYNHLDVNTSLVTQVDLRSRCLVPLWIANRMLKGLWLGMFPVLVPNPNITLLRKRKQRLIYVHIEKNKRNRGLSTKFYMHVLTYTYMYP